MQCLKEKGWRWGYLSPKDKNGTGLTVEQDEKLTWPQPQLSILLTAIPLQESMAISDTLELWTSGRNTCRSWFSPIPTVQSLKPDAADYTIRSLTWPFRYACVYIYTYTQMCVCVWVLDLRWISNPLARTKKSVPPKKK